MQALKALCEIRLEKDDIVGLIEDAIKPCKATRQAAKQTGVWPSLDDFRREPLGEDSSGLIYHYFDLHLSPRGYEPWLSQSAAAAMSLDFQIAVPSASVTRDREVTLVCEMTPSGGCSASRLCLLQ